MAGKMGAVRNPIDGRMWLVQEKPSQNPLQKKQWVRVTVILKAATATEKAVTDTEVFYEPFMVAVQKMQAKWPGKPVSCANLPLSTASDEMVLKCVLDNKFGRPESTTSEAAKKKAE